MIKRPGFFCLIIPMILFGCSEPKQEKPVKPAVVTIAPDQENQSSVLLNLPDWMPRYDSVASDYSDQRGMNFITGGDPETVVAFYDSTLRLAGFTVEVTTRKSRFSGIGRGDFRMIKAYRRCEKEQIDLEMAIHGQTRTSTQVVASWATGN